MSRAGALFGFLFGDLRRGHWIFSLAVEHGAPGNVDQILIVRGAVNFGLRGAQFVRYRLHVISSC